MCLVLESFLQSHGYITQPPGLFIAGHVQCFHGLINSGSVVNSPYYSARPPDAHRGIWTDPRGQPCSGTDRGAAELMPLGYVAQRMLLRAC